MRKAYIIIIINPKNLVNIICGHLCIGAEKDRVRRQKGVKERGCFIGRPAYLFWGKEEPSGCG